MLLFPGREARGGAGALDGDAARRCFTGPPRQPSSRVSSRRRSSRTCRGRVVDVSCSCPVDARVGGARGRGCGAAGGPRAAALAPGGGGDLRPPGAAARGRIRILGRGRAALLGRRTRGRRDFADRAARRERQRKDHARPSCCWAASPHTLLLIAPFCLRLVKLLLGDLAPTAGEVVRNGGARIGLVNQVCEAAWERRPVCEPCTSNPLAARPATAPRRPDRPHAHAAPVPDGPLPGRRLVRARAGAALAPAR